MKRIVSILAVLACLSSVAAAQIKAGGKFTAIGNVTSPVTLYTTATAGLYRVTIYVEDITRLQGWFGPVYPATSFTSPHGLTVVGTPFGNQNSSWAGSDTEIVFSVAASQITFTASVAGATDTYEYIYVIEKL